MNRRDALRSLTRASVGLALASSFPTSVRPLVRSPLGPPVKIFLHGFFFIDVQDQLLIAAAPDHPNHHFLFRSDGDTAFTDIPMSVQRFDDGTLTPASSKPNWPRSILNFNKSKVGLDARTITPVWSNTLRCLLVLPFPNRITPHRNGGSIDEFTLGGNVGASILQSCDKALSLSISLEYDSSNSAAFGVRHYYAEHCDTPNDDEIADMLRKARNAFGPKFRQQFDLTISHIPTTAGTITTNPDEQVLGELQGFRNNPCPPLPAAQRDARKRLLEGLSPEKQKEIFQIRTANCPIFGMI